MASNKYAEELERERKIIARGNPFAEEPATPQITTKAPESVPYVTAKKKDTNYFNMILGSDFEDLEMEIRGLRYYKELDIHGSYIITTKRRANHYLSEDGAEDLLLELKAHLSSDIKLGILTMDEFKMTQDIIRKFLISYVSNNLFMLGMDTEEKQRKAPTLLVMMLARIRAVYSRSVAGIENQRSHGDIKLSGDLDLNKEEFAGKLCDILGIDYEPSLKLLANKVERKRNTMRMHRYHRFCSTA